MKNNKLAAGLLLAAARSALICCGIYLLALKNGGTGEIYPLSLIAYAVAAFLFNRLILRKDRAVISLVWLNFALCAAYFLAVTLLQPWSSFRKAAAAAVMIAIVTAAEAKDNYDSIGLHDVIITVDASFLCLALSMAVLFGVEYSPMWALCAIAGVIFSFAALLCYRLDGIGRAGRIGVLSVGAAAGLVITLAASRKVASSVGGVIMAVWGAVLSALSFVLRCIDRFFRWLASFAPEIEGELELDAVDSIALPTEETAEKIIDPTWLLCAILACAAAAALIYLIRKKPRVSARGRASAIRISSERTGLRFALKRLFEKLGRALRLARALRRKRRTPAGVYLRVSKCAVKPQSCETAREYLSRLSSHECVEKGEKAILAELASAVDRQLYSPSACEPFPRSSELRFFGARLGLRLLGRDLRRAFSRKRRALSHSSR